MELSDVCIPQSAVPHLPRPRPLRSLRRRRTGADPARARRKRTPFLRAATFCIKSLAGRWLIEQRPPKGRWAGMWQFVTLVADESAGVETLQSLLLVPVSRPRLIGTVTHGLTHRRYH